MSDESNTPYRSTDVRHSAMVRFLKEHKIISNELVDSWSRDELLAMLDDANRLGFTVGELHEMLAEGQ